VNDGQERRSCGHRGEKLKLIVKLVLARLAGKRTRTMLQTSNAASPTRIFFDM